MKRLILELGLYNATFWLALACAVCVAFRGRLPAASWRMWRPIALLTIFMAAANIGLGLGRAFVSPRDLLQDVVSAKEFLAGRSMYPDAMTDRFAKLLAEEEIDRKPNLGWTLTRLGEKSREGTMSQHWVQAHPPFMSVFFAGLYGHLGLLGTQISLALISLACLVWSVAAIVGELQPGWGRWRTIALAAGFCGSGPVVTSFRNGQADLILLALLVAAWLLLRRGRLSAAGLAIGIAVSFKLIPALLLPVLLVRWPRAFLVALATAGAVLLSIVLNTGASFLADYHRTAEGIVVEYATYPSNISLLGFITRGYDFFDWPIGPARQVWQAAGLFIGCGLMYLARYRRLGNDRSGGGDYIFALAVSLMPLCSPVAWDHYLTFLILPLAVIAANRPVRFLAPLALAWAIPETAYFFIRELLDEQDLHAISVWVVDPVRTYAIVGLAGCIAARSFRTDGLNSPQARASSTHAD